MKIAELRKLIARGEDSRIQFKADVNNVNALAAEMVAFANSEGGLIIIGIGNDGQIIGLSRSAVERINQLISNAASQHVRSPISPLTENVAVSKGRVVIVANIPKGIDKPYFDRGGVIWLKSGADKRRVNSKEELRRLFQMSDQFHADELPTKAGIDVLDKLRFRDFLRDFYKRAFPDDPAELTRLLQNMNLATDAGMLNLAGVLMFAERPEWIKPQFVVKAIRYPGNKIHATDYLVSAPIRLFIFDNRIEIISPGHLPDNLTVGKILAGISNIRNPILVSYVAKGLLPYHGLGSGIQRALDAWSRIVFTDDRDGCLFTATVHRKPVEDLTLVISSPKTSGKTSGKIVAALKQDGYLTIPDLASMIGVTERSIERNIRKLQDENRLRRIGPAKGGHWEVTE